MTLSGAVPFTDNFCTHECFCWREGVPQGLPILDVYASSLDDVWAVGPATLMRFDGTSWRRAVVEEGVVVTAIAGRSHDDVWAVADDGSLFSWDGDQLVRRATDAPGALHAVALDPDGTVWVGGDEGYVARGRQTLAVVELALEDSVRFLRAISSGSTWVGTPEEAVHVRNGAVAQRVPLSGYGAPLMAETSATGSTWILTRSKHYDVEDGSWSATPLPFDAMAACRATNGEWYAGERPAESLREAPLQLRRWSGGAWQRVGEQRMRASSLSCVGETVLRFGREGQLVADFGDDLTVLTHRAQGHLRLVVASTTGRPPTFATTTSGTLLARGTAGWERLEEDGGPPMWSENGVRMWLEAGGTDGWIVDQGGWVLRTDGDAVTRQPPLPSVDRPLDVAAAGPESVFVVGEGGRVDRFDGEAWTPLESGTDATLRLVWARTANDAWVVGANGMSGPWVRHWDGTSFTIDEELDALGSCSPVAIHGSEDGAVFLVDYCGHVFRNVGGAWSAVPDIPREAALGNSSLWAFSEVSVLVADRTGSWLLEGDTWTLLEEPMTPPLYGPTGLWASSPDDVWAAYAGGLRHWDGVTWSEGVPPDDVRSFSFALGGRSADDVWLHVSTWNKLHNGIVRWNGVDWRALENVQPFLFSDLYEDDDGGVTGVASLGRVVTWSGERQRLDTPAFSFPSAVLAASRDDLRVGDVQGRVWRREGGSWTSTQVADGGVFALWGAPEGDVWAGGGVSVLGGAPFLARLQAGAWQPHEMPLEKTVTSIAGRASDDVYAAVLGNDPQDREGHVLHFDGEAWSVDGSLGTPSFPRLWVTDSDVFAVAVSGGGPVLRRTADGWVPVTPRLSSVLSVTQTDDGGLEILGETGELYRPPLPWNQNP